MVSYICLIEEVRLSLSLLLVHKINIKYIGLSVPLSGQRIDFKGLYPFKKNYISVTSI